MAEVHSNRSKYFDDIGIPREMSLAKASAEIATLSVPSLYRRLLKAAADYPTKNKRQILLAIKEEFRANQHVDSEKASRLITAAMSQLARCIFTPEGSKAMRFLAHCLPMSIISQLQQHGKSFAEAGGLQYQFRSSTAPGAVSQKAGLKAVRHVMGTTQANQSETCEDP